MGQRFGTVGKAANVGHPQVPDAVFALEEQPAIERVAPGRDVFDDANVAPWALLSGAEMGKQPPAAAAAPRPQVLPAATVDPQRDGDDQAVEHRPGMNGELGKRPGGDQHNSRQKPEDHEKIDGFEVNGGGALAEHETGGYG